MVLDLDISHHPFQFTHKATTLCAPKWMPRGSLFLNSNLEVSYPLSTNPFPSQHRQCGTRSPLNSGQLHPFKVSKKVWKPIFTKYNVFISVCWFFVCVYTFHYLFDFHLGAVIYSICSTAVEQKTTARNRRRPVLKRPLTMLTKS